MAKCEKREIKPEPPPVEYVLTLSAHEAGQIKHLVAQGQSNDATHRIWEAMERAGVEVGEHVAAYTVIRQ